MVLRKWIQRLCFVQVLAEVKIHQEHYLLKTFLDEAGKQLNYFDLLANLSDTQCFLLHSSYVGRGKIITQQSSYSSETSDCQERQTLGH